MTSFGITPEYEKKAEQFYRQVLGFVVDKKIPVMIGGTYAVKYYTGIDRPTKDIDIFCKAGDYPKILDLLKRHGYTVEVLDDRWLAKIKKDPYFIDLIFGSIPGFWPITDDWFKRAPKAKVLGHEVSITPPEELIVSKAYRLGRAQFDGADVTHLLLKCGPDLDWEHLLKLMEPHWELLLMHLILFRFTYPSERDTVPEWLIQELISRMQAQANIPAPKDKITRGPMLSARQYRIAVQEWGYLDVSQANTTRD